MEEDLSLLAETALFNGLALEEIRALCAAFHCRSVSYPRGSVILKRGDRVERAGIVLSGSVRAERNGPDGELRIVARHGARSLFGDVLTVSPRRRSPVDIVASEDTRVLLVPLAAIMRDEAPACREAQTRVRMNLLSGLSEKYWALSRQNELLRAPSLRAKLARRLLMERDARGSCRFRLPGTRETLAAELGVNRSSLSRELSRMAREGLLSARRDSFTLHDPEALERLAGE